MGNPVRRIPWSTLGVRFDPIPQITPGDMLKLTLSAEERGYDTVWVPEGGGFDATTLLSSFAVATSRVRIATGILPVFSRTPTLTAAAAAGLDLLSNHRFTLGLGTGHRGFVEAGHGIAFERPITRLRETVEIVRRLLTGKPVSYDGKVYSLSEAVLGFPQEFSIPIYIAALGPQVVGLAGEVADGVLLNWASPAYLSEAVVNLHQGAAKAGRRPDDLGVACYIRVAVTEDVDAVREPLRRQLLRYVGMEYYRNFFESTGFAEEMQAMARYMAQGETDKALSCVSDEMQRQLAIFGPAEFCRQEVERRRGLGLTMPVIAPFAVGDPLKSYRATVEAFSG